jgi:hypothetical protein
MTWPGTGESSTVTSHDRVNLPCVCRTSWTDLFCGARNACGDVSYRMWLAPSSCTCSAKPCHACWDRGHGRKLAPHAVHPQIPRQRKHRLEPLNFAFHGTGLRPIQLFRQVTRPAHTCPRVVSLAAMRIPVQRLPVCHPQLKAPHAALGLANRTTLSPLVRSNMPNHCLRSTRDARRQTWQYIV